MSDSSRQIQINAQVTVLIDADGKQKIINTKNIVDRMAQVNAFFDTNLIHPGIRYLSADYIVDGKTFFDVMFEIPPHRVTHDGKQYFIPWVSVICTIGAEAPKYKKPFLLPGSLGIFISETQIYTQLTEVHVPTFVHGIDDRGFIQATEFYGDFCKLVTPLNITQLINGLHEIFERAFTIDHTHPDLAKLVDVQINNGYDVNFDSRSASKAEFKFDFPFLPSFEVDYIVSNFGYNIRPAQQIHSLFDFFSSLAKEDS